MKILKTSEAFAALEANPKIKLENHNGNKRTVISIGLYGYFIANVFVDGVEVDPIKGAYNFCGNFTPESIWTLVREPVPVWEAIKAYCEGKKAYCVFKTFGDKEGRFYLQGSNNWGFSGKLLTEGKWFIEDTPNES